MHISLLVLMTLLGSRVTAQHAEPDVNDATHYGGKMSVGVAVGGGGLIGVPVRVYPMPMLRWR